MAVQTRTGVRIPVQVIEGEAAEIAIRIVTSRDDSWARAHRLGLVFLG